MEKSENREDVGTCPRCSRIISDICQRPVYIWINDPSPFQAKKWLDAKENFGIQILHNKKWVKIQKSNVKTSHLGKAVFYFCTSCVEF